MEKCDNCGKELRADQRAFVWNDLAVCGDCLRVLRNSEASKKVIAEPVVDIPRFVFLQFVATLIRIAGAATAVCGILFLAVVSSKNPVQLESGAAAIALIVSGLVQVAIGEALECLRAIAVNSFYIRSQTQTK